MFCRQCGKEMDGQAAFCSYCGASTGKGDSDVLYHLPLSQNRECDICVYPDRVTFQGKFWYLVNKEFVNPHKEQESAQIQNFLGLGYLAKRSYKKCVLFVVSGFLLQMVKLVIDKLSEGVDKINSYLQWVGHSISLPPWMNITMNVIAVICLLLGLILFFSKKKVIEISFTDKRICVPQKSMSAIEYQTLYQTIMQKRYGYSYRKGLSHSRC